MSAPSHASSADPVRRGIRSTQAGLVANAVLASIKLAAGLIGNAYALVADAAESMADILASLIVWGGLAIAAQPADENHPYGHGKAEALAGAAVSLMLVGAAVGIAVEAVQQIRSPHEVPAPWTLVVLVVVMLVKWLLARRVHAVGEDLGSTAVQADASHHLSDAITSAAAFVGISVAILGARNGGGARWAAADDWAALFAAGVILYNGVNLFRPALHDLMDRMPGTDVIGPVADAARDVAGVLAVEKLVVRKAGMHYFVDIHVQADPSTSLHDAHIIGGCVKGAIRRAIPAVAGVLVHMEPYEETAALEGRR
ncbi:cation diffusion facilitator family transporter [Gemmatirosa kalamazoonensis]|uniref:Cation diffusion facilitator family transporter n=1 Tax=Gemmatirosa kalamazoonensis TaxID=861299 RepID=W0REC8_9BACT|nr:cation diffusion facilitator family transporter [Gemmatirosa kalamazoonensis]AHG87713.1 cation diffusion facilitator family transporter [Gemmatirosa kalamazoonensis]